MGKGIKYKHSITTTHSATIKGYTRMPDEPVSIWVTLERQRQAREKGKGDTSKGYHNISGTRHQNCNWIDWLNIPLNWKENDLIS